MFYIKKDSVQFLLVLDTVFRIVLAYSI